MQALRVLDRRSALPVVWEVSGPTDPALDAAWADFYYDLRHGPDPMAITIARHRPRIEAALAAAEAAPPPEREAREALREALVRAEAIDVLPYYDDPGSDSFNYDKYREDVVRAALARAAPPPVRHVRVNAAGQCACGQRWSEEHEAQAAP